ncbi:OmpW/AlkL family protein [Cupriavidus taiwanensis]|uniref:Putative Outer membrane protein, OmpW family n=1 Tax=Cupriavidus taiwanensis TaxID=164546 RepID=A0A375IWG7_9BURK|nr:OmpW family outer membrane protein [Cupriavidus taiwanensis]SPR95880.1 putative Outer membrane protein, OmpW family [Cupriavidus taiwanensis]
MKTLHLTLALALAALASIAMPAHAQKKGDNVVSAGWFHIRTHGQSDPLTTTLLDVPINYPLGLPSSFTSPGSSISSSNANTLGLTFSHFVTDHIAITAVGGIPPEFKLYGHGELIPPGPAGALGRQSLGDPSLNPIITKARQWSPAAMVQYHFLEPGTRFRPFLGLGVSYNFFTNIEVNPAFASSVNNNLGAILAAGAGIPGPTSVSADASSSWAPVFNIGGTYNFDEHWGLTAAVTYIPLKTTSTMTIKAANGTVLSTSKTKLEPNPLVFFVAASYKF